MSTAAAAVDAGAAWVDRYLAPVAARRHAGWSAGGLRCVHLDAQDGREAARLAAHGHRGECALSRDVLDGRLRGPIDLAWTGRFASVALAERAAFASRLHAALAPGGALLLVVANRRCPVDVSTGGLRWHGGRDDTLPRWQELAALFPAAGFASVEALGLRGHFGWSRLGPAGRLAAMPLEAWLATGARWLHASAGNPLLAAWIAR